MTRMMMFSGMINRKILNQVNSTNHIQFKDVRLFLQSVAASLLAHAYHTRIRGYQI